MQALLKISRAIDALNQQVGKATIWLVLVVTVISALNAVVRYAFNYSSNGLLEIQWYLFSAIFLLCAGYTLMRNARAHDVVSSRFAEGACLDRHHRHAVLPGANGHRRAATSAGRSSSIRS